MCDFLAILGFLRKRLLMCVQEKSNKKPNIKITLRGVLKYHTKLRVTRTLELKSAQIDF